MKKTKVRINQRRFFLNILLPTFLTFGLFTALIFTVIIPSFEQNLLDAKKEMTQELVNACTGIAAKYDMDAKQGLITEEEAKAGAISTISHLRYGINNKDYFWITDMKPVMIMHPYRPDLDGQDLSEFQDPEGKKLFVEMVQVVKVNQSGYVDYMWQWMDDSTRIVPKISYVSEFKPWGWVIGTGVYIEDVRMEIAAIIRRLIIISAGISVIMMILMFIIVRNNLKAEKKRNDAEDKLKDSRERYKALVEASDEGTLMMLNAKCVYANQKIKEILEMDDFSMLSEHLKEIIHPSCVGDVRTIADLNDEPGTNRQLETLLSGKDGKAIPALLSISSIEIGDEKGLIINIKDLRTDKAEEILGGVRTSPMWLLAENMGYGAFRAQAGRKGRFIKANLQASRILGFSSLEEMLQHNILDLVEEPDARMQFLRAIATTGSVKDFSLHIKKANGQYAEIRVTATLVENESSGLPYSEGFFEDFTEQAAMDRVTDQVMTDLQTLAQLDSAPILSVAQEVPSCPPETSIEDCLKIMNSSPSDTLLVRMADGTFIGIITEKSLRKRGLDILQNPGLKAVDLMFAPIPWVQENMPISKAASLLAQEDSGVLVIKNLRDQKPGFINALQLAQINRNPSAYLTMAIQQAESVSEIRAIYAKLPVFIKVMVQSGARTSTIYQIVDALADSITRKVCEQAIREKGTPPCSFALICMGSQGRGEQTLVTDQDNAIIYENQEDNKEKVEQYFLGLGQRINELLAEVAYELCKGGIMAGNPKWNQPLNAWKKYFHAWITNPEPQNLLETSIFFDFRCAYGDLQLCIDLRKAIDQHLANNPAFFGQMAKLCIQYKIPLGMFGKLQTESNENQENGINIKNAIRVIVSIVRLYAMQHNSPETSTPDRMMDLYSKNVISSALYNDLHYAFEYLSFLQIKTQAQKHQDLQPIDHYIDLAMLPGIEIEMLKTVFSKLSVFQSKIKYDFGITGN